MYHVTRQSFGVCKLYCKDFSQIKFQTILIYVINFIFFLVAFFRFYVPIIKTDHLLIINIFVIALMFLISIYYIFKFRFSENYLIFLIGCLIFYPACFVNNPVHIILMGVTMHYTQYLYLTNHVQKSRAESSVNNYEYKKKSFYSFLIIIIIYSCVMTFFSSMGKFDNSWLKELIFIPILGQMLHFYLDSQLWKFSEKHNRDNTLIYLSKII